MKTVRAFARIAGVTPKTLRHYERRRLISPRRNAAGYRVYSDRDLRRVRDVLALKTLGLSLTEIRELLAGRRAPIELLRAQRESLERKRRSLDRAIDVIREVERVETARSTHDRALATLIAEASWSLAELRRAEAAPVPRASWRHWPRGMKEWAASLYDMNVESFERLARFMDDVAASMPGAKP